MGIITKRDSSTLGVKELAYCQGPLASSLDLSKDFL